LTEMEGTLGDAHESTESTHNNAFGPSFDPRSMAEVDVLSGNPLLACNDPADEQQRKAFHTGCLLLQV
jgi:hypothetical protein